mmetsp:Transcript_74187/g.197102  ORF Transcript_74187/g.197102 Transcript_74187/m.197102 type:complete len:255 (+) Transcript_74187:16-780(+)
MPATSWRWRWSRICAAVQPGAADGRLCSGTASWRPAVADADPVRQVREARRGTAWSCAGDLPLLQGPERHPPAAAAVDPAAGLHPAARSAARSHGWPARPTAVGQEEGAACRHQLLWDVSRAEGLHQRRPPYEGRLAGHVWLPGVARLDAHPHGRQPEPTVPADSGERHEGLPVAGPGRAARRRALLPLLGPRSAAGGPELQRGGRLRRDDLPLGLRPRRHDRGRRDLRRHHSYTALGRKADCCHGLLPQWHWP